MSVHSITIEGSSSVRLPVAGKYCDRDIVVTAVSEGVELPALSSPGTAADLMAGKQMLNGEGKVVDGEFTLETEMTAQDSLIEQIKAALQGKTVGGGGDSGLPAGYARADYIRFTGEQIVDTGVVCTQDTRIKVVFTREKSSQHYMYGVASSDNTASVTAYLGGSWRFGNKSSTKTPTTNADMIYSGDVDSSKITITGSAATISGVNEFETVGSLLLGSCRGAAGSIGAAQFAGKIFFFAMWQEDVQVLKLVPVVSTDGVYRFYDEVSGTFFDSITDTPLEGGNL